MRVLHILNHINQAGNGIVNVALDLACLQARAGHDVGIAAGDDDRKYQVLLNEYGVKHFNLNQNRSFSNLIKATKTFLHIVKTFQPDIVHAHMMTGVVLAKVLRTNANYGLVSTVHNEFLHRAIMMGCADRVIAVSQAVADSMQSRGVPFQKLRVVRNGTFGSPRMQPLTSYTPLSLQRPAITTVAGMCQRKGIAELIAAFSQIAAIFPDVHLYLVGNGPDRDLFETQAQQTTVADRIHFEGFQSEPQRYLLATDIFVLASYQEPFALALCEAREAGCAIIASNVDGSPEVLEGGKAGILIPSRSSAAIADVLTKLLSNPDDLSHWKTCAQQNIDWLSVDRVYEETLEIYRELNPASTSKQLISVRNVQF